MLVYLYQGLFKLERELIKYLFALYNALDKLKLFCYNIHICIV